ncbi:putative amidoligase enzyme-domain-containing protein [Hypoxylon rubiginosum]|uniref:Amidoligase enzyme-domain-containing protein n=1 Tax=Hypoxylon rubiginosum TaxID=110542 RepID=A0ACC0DN67_9PEZI|nr:putative amidoligase enzyme-domain-containing protein [Hypoxylon rubiginosum]
MASPKSSTPGISTPESSPLDPYPEGPPPPKSPPSERFKLQVNTLHSVGIELEFLLAYLPTAAKDPLESIANSLPPLLRVDLIGYAAAVEVMGRIRKTLKEHGIRVATPEFKERPPNVPRRLHQKDMWEVGLDVSVKEKFDNRFKWVGVEVRSPALWSKADSYEEVGYVVNVLTSNFRLRVNPTCGFHVHVGNGRNLFTADTIKRLGAFLWAADPMLSRLHAPWRRVNGYSPSIRYQSKMACEGLNAAKAEEAFKNGQAAHDPSLDPEELETREPRIVDPIAVTDFSDTSLEEKDYGGKENWETAARLLSKTGPFMTFGKDLDDVRDFVDEENSQSDQPVDIASHESNERPPDHLLSAGREMLDRLVAQSIPSRDLQPEEHHFHRNLQWVEWDDFDPKVVEWLFYYCQTTFGHRNLRIINADDQALLLLWAQCTFLFGHQDILKLSVDEQTQLLESCSDYFQAARSTFERNPETDRWEIKWWNVGSMLHQPDAQRETDINAPYIIQKFDNLVGLMDMQGENNDNGIEYVSRHDYERAQESSKGLENLLNDLRDYAEEPVFEKAQSDSSDYDGSSCSTWSASPDSGGDYAPAAWTATQRANGSGPSSPAVVVLASTKADAKKDETDGWDHSGSSSPWGTSSSGGDYAPAAWVAAREKFKESRPHNPPPAPVPSPAGVYPKLKPHDPNDITVGYVEKIGKYCAEVLWDRIGWIPSTTHPLSDPAGDWDGENYTFVPNPKVSTWQGVDEIMSCNSALTAATLLQGARQVRTNYNFNHYIEDYLDEVFDDDVSTNPRTIEFREAEGTLDARWITMYMRICVGIVRFARRSGVMDYFTVLEKISEQEERDLVRKEALAGGAETYEFEERDEAERYDVCDLLEDICLFVEAAFVRKRENNRMKEMYGEAN